MRGAVMKEETVAIDEIEISEEEILKIAEEQKATVKLMFYFRKLVAGYESPRLFLNASEADYKRRVRYGEGLASLVGRVKERCFFILRHEKARLLMDERVQAFIREQKARFEKEAEKLNPVFSQSDMENITLYMREAHLEYIDIRVFNDFRHSITAGQVEAMRRRHEKEAAERKERERKELEEMQRREKERPEGERPEKEGAERERSEKDKPDKGEKGRKDGRK